jgi:dTDP-4-amino-4,6-dideoxygalactose transaminase
MPAPAPRRDTLPRIPFSDWYVAPSARTAAARALATGWVANGPEVSSFEVEFARHVGARFAVAVSSGTTALELALEVLQLPRGSRVLVSTLSSFAVAQAIVRAGLRPVLVDVSVLTGMPSRTTIHEAATRAELDGGPPRALLLGHPAGDPADVSALADAAGLPTTMVVEDAAQGLGGSLGDRPVGGQGTACFSFYATTNLPVGEGGMVTTDDPERAEQIRAARSHTSLPRPRRGGHNSVTPGSGVRDGGLDASMTDLRAAIGRGQLAHLVQWQRRREQFAELYDAQLADIKGVVLPHRPASGEGSHAWHHYPLRVEHPSVHRDAVIRALFAARVRTADRLSPLHQLRYARELCEVADGGLPGADQFDAQLVALPIYPRLPDGAANRVAEVLAGMLSVDSSS